MSDLVKKINDTANTSRLGTVEAAYAGAAGSRSNFKGLWRGFNSLGQGLVSFEGRTYTSITIGSTSIPYNSQVAFRVGQGIKTSHW